MTWFEEHWPRTWPVELVMEGLDDDEPVTFPRHTPVQRTIFKCILDPIDGTRNLMYDKRSAWSLAGLAVQCGPSTHLGDLMVAAMTELPTSKQGWADQVSAVRGRGRRGVVAHRIELASGRRESFAIQPSKAGDFQHAWASLVKFFPAGKALTAQIEEALWNQLHLRHRSAGQLVFDDQYLASGGQIYELLVGHDRMIVDLRPLVFRKLGLDSALSCHPYDICTALILTEAGGAVERPGGGALNIPLDTVSPVAWAGYANQKLARTVRPVLKRLIAQYLG